MPGNVRSKPQVCHLLTGLIRVCARMHQHMLQAPLLPSLSFQPATKTPWLDWKGEDIGIDEDKGDGWGQSKAGQETGISNFHESRTLSNYKPVSVSWVSNKEFCIFRGHDAFWLRHYKAWWRVMNYLVHFGGHSSHLTCVMWWRAHIRPHKTYQTSQRISHLTAPITPHTTFPRVQSRGLAGNFNTPNRCFLYFQISVDWVGISGDNPSFRICEREKTHPLLCLANVVSPFLYTRGGVRCTMEEVWCMVRHVTYRTLSPGGLDYTLPV